MPGGQPHWRETPAGNAWATEVFPGGGPPPPPPGTPRHPGPATRSAKRWRLASVVGIPLAFIIGVGTGQHAPAPAPERPTERLTVVPPPASATRSAPAAQTPAQPTQPDITKTAASVPAEPLAGVGDDGAVDTRVYYSNCAAARADGAAPLFEEDPGYRRGLDRDNDGVACE